MISSPYVLIGNPLTLTVIRGLRRARCAAGRPRSTPLGLGGPVWIYVGAGITSLILWVAASSHWPPLRRCICEAFAPYASGFLALAVMSADHLADVDLQEAGAGIRSRSSGIVPARHRAAL